MSNKKVAELYRLLADKLDEIEGLQLRLHTQEQLTDTINKQLMLANDKISGLTVRLEQSEHQLSEVREIGQKFHKKATDNVEILGQVKRVFGSYDSNDFDALEAMAWEAKGSVRTEDFETETEYVEEQEYIDNLIMLAEEIKIIKGEFFDDKGEEDYEGLKEF